MRDVVPIITANNATNGAMTVTMTPRQIAANRVQEATRKFEQADQAWAAALPNTVNARYLPVGRGKPGSHLRALWTAREAMRAEFEHAWRDYHNT